MTKEGKNPKARSEKGVPFAWPPIVVGMVDPLRMGQVQ